jgi:hypothetical protein
VLDKKIQNALAYLAKSAEGPKFVLDELPGMSFDDGPFGDERYSGVEELPAEDNESGVAAEYLKLELVLVDSDDVNLVTKWLSGEIVYRYRDKLLILATPRDPKGAFTVSIYDHENHIGWIIGPDADKLSSHLVANYDFGAALIEVFRLKNDGNKINLSIPTSLLESDPPKTNESLITSQNLVPPSELTWSEEEVIRKLPKGITWEGQVFTELNIENDKALRLAGVLEDDFFSVDNECVFVPDIWDSKSKRVLAYVDDMYIGRIQDPAVEARFFQELTKDGHSIGLANEVWFEEDDETSRIKGFVRCDVRDVQRIDWASVAAN